MFVLHWFGITMDGSISLGMYEEFTVKWTSKDDSSAHNQSVQTPLTLMEDILVELEILHQHRIITRLLFSKLATQMFTQKKPMGNCDY